jgi:hypothetical protein
VDCARHDARGARRRLASVAGVPELIAQASIPAGGLAVDRPAHGARGEDLGLDIEDLGRRDDAGAGPGGNLGHGGLVDVGDDHLGPGGGELLGQIGADVADALDRHRHAIETAAEARGFSDAAIDNGTPPDEAARRILDAVRAGEREWILAEGKEAEIAGWRCADPNALFDQMARLVCGGYARQLGATAKSLSSALSALAASRSRIAATIGPPSTNGRA